MIMRGIFRRHGNVDELARVVKRASVLMAIASTIMLIVWVVKRTMIKNSTASFLTLAIPILTLIMATFCNISARRKSFRFALVAMCLSIMLMGLHILNLELAITTHAIPLIITLDCIVILLRIGLAIILYKFLVALYRGATLFTRLSSQDSLSFSSSSSNSSSFDTIPSSTPPSFIITSSSPSYNQVNNEQ